MSGKLRPSVLNQVIEELNIMEHLAHPALGKALREDAEWASANEWESPLTLGDNLTGAADTLENDRNWATSLQCEIEKLRAERDELKKRLDMYGGEDD